MAYQPWNDRLNKTQSDREQREFSSGVFVSSKNLTPLSGHSKVPFISALVAGFLGVAIGRNRKK